MVAYVSNGWRLDRHATLRRRTPASRGRPHAPHRRFYGCNLVLSDIAGPTEPMPLRDREIVADPEAVAQDLCADFADLCRADRA